MATIDRTTQPFAEATAALRRRTANLVPTRRWDDLQREAHDRAFVVAGAMQADLLADLAQAVDDAISKGLGLDYFRKQFDKITAKHGWQYEGGRNWRTRVIFQTNMLSSYAAGRLAQLRDADLLKLKPAWMYKHSDNVAAPRPLHVSWDGLVLPADHGWWDTHYPPNGWGCRCRVVAVSETEARRLGGRFGPVPDDGTNADGVPNGIDPGWDYMPGGSDSAQTTLARKAAAAPATLGTPLQQQVQQQLAPYVPKDLDEMVRAGRRLLDAIVTPFIATPIAAQARLLKALAARRTLGGGAATGSKAAVALWRQAADRYPKDWSDEAAKAGTLRVRQTRGRAHYSHSQSELTLSDVSSGVHEYGHRLQFTMPALDAWFVQMHRRRTAGERLEQLRVLTSEAYESHEVARRDKYIDPYFGREYGVPNSGRNPAGQGSPWEVLPMTFQSLLSGDARLFDEFVRADPELASLGLGLLWYWKP